MLHSREFAVGLPSLPRPGFKQAHGAHGWVDFDGAVVGKFDRQLFPAAHKHCLPHNALPVGHAPDTLARLEA